MRVSFPIMGISINAKSVKGAANGFIGVLRKKEIQDNLFTVKSIGLLTKKSGSSAIVLKTSNNGSVELNGEFAKIIWSWWENRIKMQ